MSGTIQLSRILVVGIGHACLDLVLLMKEIAKPGTLARAYAMRIAVGGPTAAGLVALQKLGACTRLVCGMGKGPLGKVLRELIAESGVDVTYLAEVDADPSWTAVGVDAAGERTFWHLAAANEALTDLLVPEKALNGASGALWAGAGLTGLDGAPAGRLFKHLAELKIPTAIDLVDIGKDEPGSAFPVIAEALPNAGQIFVSIKEAKQFTGYNAPGDIAAFLQDRGANTVVVKQGERGIAVAPKGESIISVPAYDIVPKDTTGSGDAASAAFFARSLQGYALDKCAQFAAAVGAIVAQQGKGTAGLYSEEDVLRFMASTPVRN